MREVTRFQSETGGLFDTACEAIRDDLRTRLAKAMDNEPAARLAADDIVASLREYSEIFKQLNQHCPCGEPELGMPIHYRDGVRI